MSVRAEFTDKQPDYKYMKLGNNKADVFIYDFVEKQTDEDGNITYAYDFNSFRVNTEEVTEEMIKENPTDYLDYPVEVEEITLEERISAIEDAIIEIGEVVYND